MTDSKLLKDIASAKKQLIVFGEKLFKGKYGTREELFRGADIIVLEPGSPLINQQAHWLDNDVRIVTPHAKELSWLLIKLRDLFYEYDLIDYSNKYIFFGELGQVAIKYHESGRGSKRDKQGLLIAVYNEAEIILKTMLKYDQFPPRDEL